MSGPRVWAISENIPSAAEPDSGLTIIIGIISAGILKWASNGANVSPANSIIPEALSIDIATIIATRYGIILTETLKPSFAPSVKTSYIGTFLISPIVKISIIIKGNAQSDIKFITE